MSTPAPNSLQLVDDQQVVLTVEAEDSEGQPVTDTYSWQVDVSATIAITPSEDGTSCLCVAGVPGTANVTVTDGSTPPLSATESFTVIAGSATQLVITPGAIETQP